MRRRCLDLPKPRYRYWRSENILRSFGPRAVVPLPDGYRHLPLIFFETTGTTVWRKKSETTQRVSQQMIHSAVGLRRHVVKYAPVCRSGPLQTVRRYAPTVEPFQRSDAGQLSENELHYYRDLIKPHRCNRTVYVIEYFSRIYFYIHRIILSKKKKIYRIFQKLFVL